MQINNIHRIPGSISIIAAPVGSRLPDHPDLEVDAHILGKKLGEYFVDGLASQIHIHARHPQTKKPTGNPEHYEALVTAIKEFCPADTYLSITTTDTHMPPEEKQFHGVMARAAALRMQHSCRQPDRIPIIDALSLVLHRENNVKRLESLRSETTLFQQQALELMEIKNIGFEIEIPNIKLLEVAKEFINKMRNGISAGIYSKDGAIAHSLDGLSFQLLFGARANMPCTVQHLNNVVNIIHESFDVRSLQVGFQGINHNHYDPLMVEAALDLAQSNKISGIRIGIEDTPYLTDHTPSTTRGLLEDVKRRIITRGIHLNTPAEAASLINNPLRRLSLESTPPGLYRKGADKSIPR